jgi:large subunit ribosomal protein L22
MQKTVYAKSKYVRKAPRKLRLLVDLIRGKNAVKALDTLKFTNKSASQYVYKTLNSAIRNAVYNNEMEKDSLIIVEAYVDEAPVFKRGRAISRGRYHQILKRNSHIVIGVGEKEEEKNAKSTKKVKTDKKKKQDSEKTSELNEKKKEVKESKVNSKSKITK